METHELRHLSVEEKKALFTSVTITHRVNFGIPWAESVQLCGREQTHPFCKEKPCFGFVSASREM